MLSQVSDCETFFFNRWQVFHIRSGNKKSNGSSQDILMCILSPWGAWEKADAGSVALGGT